MELRTGISPSFRQRYTPFSYITEDGWDKYVAELEAGGKKIEGRSRDYVITFPEEEYTYAPTLGLVHKWLHGDWGPFYISWKAGRLCPFNPRVGQKNMTCCPGNIKNMRCCGLILEERHILGHLQNVNRLMGRVVCYEWDYLLSLAYWDLDTDWMVNNLPDDPKLVSFYIMRSVFRSAGWFDWIWEQRQRRNKGLRFWLKPMRRKSDMV